MEISINPPCSEYVQKIIDFGIADTPTEVVRQSITNLYNQIEFEELYLVDKVLQTEMEEIEKSGQELNSILV